MLRVFCIRSSGFVDASSGSCWFRWSASSWPCAFGLSPTLSCSPVLQWSLRGIRPTTFRFSGTCPLAGPLLLWGRGHKERSGSALALSLPQDRVKEGVVRSCTLGACNLSRCLLQFRAHQIFPTLVRLGCLLSVAGGFIASSAHPLHLTGAFQLLALLESLVPPSRLRVRSLQWHLLTLWSPESDHPSLPMPLSRAVRWISLRG